MPPRRSFRERKTEGYQNVVQVLGIELSLEMRDMFNRLLPTSETLDAMMWKSGPEGVDKYLTDCWAYLERQAKQRKYAEVQAMVRE